MNRKFGELKMYGGCVCACALKTATDEYAPIKKLALVGSFTDLKLHAHKATTAVSSTSIERYIQHSIIQIVN